MLYDNVKEKKYTRNITHHINVHLLDLHKAYEVVYGFVKSTNIKPDNEVAS